LVGIGRSVEALEELLFELPLPLTHQRGGREDQRAPGEPADGELLVDDARLDRLPEAHLIGEDRAAAHVAQDALGHVDLVGQLLLGNLPEFGKDLLGFITQCAREYGDIVRLRLANRVAYLLNHPDYMEYVLVTNHRNFVKNSFFWRHVKAVFGSGLLTSEGDFWLRERRLCQPAFHREQIAGYGTV